MENMKQLFEYADTGIFSDREIREIRDLLKADWWVEEENGLTEAEIFSFTKITMEELRYHVKDVSNMEEIIEFLKTIEMEYDTMVWFREENGDIGFLILELV